MQEWKQVISFIAIAVFLGRGLLPLVQYGKILDDKEFEDALQRAQEQQFPQIEETKNYPFTTMTRREAAARYAYFGDISKTPIQQEPSACEFSDIQEVSDIEKQHILKVCQYGFLK